MVSFVLLKEPVDCVSMCCRETRDCHTWSGNGMLTDKLCKQGKKIWQRVRCCSEASRCVEFQVVLGELQTTKVAVTEWVRGVGCTSYSTRLRPSVPGLLEQGICRSFLAVNPHRSLLVLHKKSVQD